MPDWQIPLSDLNYGSEEEEAVMRVIRSGWLSSGPEVQRFEEKFADAAGVRHAIALSSATAALHLAMLALDVGDGSEVIQPALNFVAAANMTIAAGAKPVFADIISVEEPTIDPNHLRSLITSRTRAVIVMHYGGYPCRMGDILDVCDARGVPVIEDACHAPGVVYADTQHSKLHGRKIGSLGRVACFSFFSNKNMATAEGGMITTDDDEIASRIRLLRSHGMTAVTWDRHRGHASSYDVTMHGFNYRLDEIRAALGQAQLARLGEGNMRRRNLIRIYRDELADAPDVHVPFAGYAGDSAGHLMPILAKNATHRNQLGSMLRENRIQSSLHYPLVTSFSAYAKYVDAQTARSLDFSERIVTLPLYPSLTPRQVQLICSLIKVTAATNLQAT